MHELMTVQEVAEYLRIKERKIYDLLAQKRIPCTRVTGKWLFPKSQIDNWLLENSEFAGAGLFGIERRASPPPILVGSHDPLLDWALREAECPLGVQTVGSMEGMQRLAAGEALVCGAHVLEPESGDYNVPVVKKMLPDQPLVVIEWGHRQQGLVVAAGNPHGVARLEDLLEKDLRFVERQPGAGTLILFHHLLERNGIDPERLNRLAVPARSETDVGLSIINGKAEAGFAIAAIAKQLQLAFIPLADERFDLILHRRDYFEPPFQRLLEFTRTQAFQDKAKEMGGYDIRSLGSVHYNGP